MIKNLETGNLFIYLRWAESVIRFETKAATLAATGCKDKARKNEEIATILRRKETYLKLERLTVEDIRLLPKSQEHPIIFIETFLEKYQPIFNKALGPLRFSKRNSRFFIRLTLEQNKASIYLF